ESRAMRPFAMWIDAFRSHESGAVELFGDAARQNRDRLFDEVSERVSRVAASRPLLLLFDDMQWCDESSAIALHHVVRTSANLPVLALVAMRDDDLRDNVPLQQVLRGLRHEKTLRKVALAPLADAEVLTLIAAHAPSADAASVAKACNGNPLFALELARAVTAGENPSSLDELVRERLARCD